MNTTEKTLLKIIVIGLGISSIPHYFDTTPISFISIMSAMSFIGLGVTFGISGMYIEANKNSFKEKKITQ